jgi:formylglycine-generating enzyme required for sulfatase activity
VSRLERIGFTACCLGALLPTLVVPTVAARRRADAMQWVSVGDPGNAPDAQVAQCCHEETGVSGFGAVAYAYRIARFEVTNEQYAEFLNAVGRSDPHALYNPRMRAIVRARREGSYVYHVAPGLERKPVGYVDLYRAARFANWLHNGEPRGDQDSTTTEDGAYRLRGADPFPLRRTPEARFFIPTEDEWYKAAYYDPARRRYHDWAVGSGRLPNPDAPPGGPRSCNMSVPPACRRESLGPCQATDVGAYRNAPSPFGTFDQCGNQIELTETPAARAGHVIVRGGGYTRAATDAASFGRNHAPATCRGCWGLGFRLAAPSD